MEQSECPMESKQDSSSLLFQKLANIASLPKSARHPALSRFLGLALAGKLTPPSLIRYSWDLAYSFNRSALTQVQPHLRSNTCIAHPSLTTSPSPRTNKQESPAPS